MASRRYQMRSQRGQRKRLRRRIRKLCERIRTMMDLGEQPQHVHQELQRLRAQVMNQMTAQILGSGLQHWAVQQYRQLLNEVQNYEIELRNLAMEDQLIMQYYNPEMAQGIPQAPPLPPGGLFPQAQQYGPQDRRRAQGFDDVSDDDPFGDSGSDYSDY